MPWNRHTPLPLLTEWAHRAQLDGTGRSAVVVGCALGADAEFVAGLGFTTVAFDVLPTAITLAADLYGFVEDAVKHPVLAPFSWLVEYVVLPTSCCSGG